MNKPYGIVVAATLAVSGMVVVGCKSSNENPNTNPAASVGGMTGGGSTDSYGTSTNARYQATGNIGTGPSEQTPATPPAPVPNDTVYGNPAPAPAQTPVGPSGGTGGAGNGVYAPGTGTFQGSITGHEAGAGTRYEVRPTTRNAPGRSETGRSETSGKVR